MVFNGSDLINQPWNTTWSPYTDFFEKTMGNGNIFYLVPVLVLTASIYVKTHNPVMASLFMVASGILMAGGSVFLNAPEMSIIFTIFTAIGFAALIMSLIFQSR